MVVPVGVFAGIASVGGFAGFDGAPDAEDAALASRIATDGAASCNEPASFASLAGGAASTAMASALGSAKSRIARCGDLDEAVAWSASVLQPRHRTAHKT
jgi:hypothetical protein